MGCDGGTIPRRDELVKTKKKPEQKDRDAERLYRWKHCSVSQSSLQYPIVACELGRMYNKEEVISRLLTKAKVPAMSHIKSLKDIKELRLTPNPSFRDDIPKGDDYFDSQTAEYICPVTSQEMNGKSKFYFIWTCGCVVSERAMKEIKSERCHICSQRFEQEDVIPLNPTDEEAVQIQVRMMERREKKKQEKKEKGKNKRADTEEGTTGQEKKKKKTTQPIEAPLAIAGSSRSLVSSYASDLLRCPEFNNVRSAKFSVAKDESKSEVFKSIFDSHESAKHKPTGHWITCNPQYF